METKFMKASDLIEILSKHPDANLCLLNVDKEGRLQVSMEIEVKYLGGSHNIFELYSLDWVKNS